MTAQTTLGLASTPVAYTRVQPELDSIANPAVDTGFTITIGTKYYERPIALAFKLVTDSNSANRQVSLVLADPAGVTVAATPVASVQAANTTYEYSFQAQLSNASTVANLVVISPLFNFVIPSSYQLIVAIASMQAGDQVSSIRWYRDRYSTDPMDYVMGGVAIDDAENVLARAAAVIG